MNRKSYTAPDFVLFDGIAAQLVSDRMTRILVIVVAMFGLTATAQAELCNHSGRYTFASNGEYPMGLTLKAGTTCEATFGSLNGTSLIFTFKRLLMVSAPERGKLKLREGGYYIYTAPNSSGADAFTVKVCGTQDNQPGCATLKFSVSVN